ncbi:MAG: CopG family ribbon-helix-helix protein [Acidobacteriota bacterium]
MEVLLPEELEAKLSRLAAEQGRDRGALVVEAVERMVDHDAWIVAEVEKGLADIERGAMLSHEGLGSRLEDRLRQRRIS